MTRRFADLDTIPSAAPALPRRRFLELMGAGVALASCARQPFEEILPYVDAPEEAPGERVYYASTALRGGYGVGILAETHAGRPTKIEGNPRHPMSLGKAGALEQALVLELYDPARPTSARRNGSFASWDALYSAMTLARNNARARQGEGLFLVLPPTSSPSVAALLTRLRNELPRASIHFWSAMSRSHAWQGAQLAFGAPLDVVVDLSKARTVIALDCDFLADQPDTLRLTRDWAERRRKDPDARLFVVDDGASLAAVNADACLRVPPSRVLTIAEALADAVLATGGSALDGAALREDERRRVLAMASAIHRGDAVVLVGDRQPPRVHVTAHALNAAAGAFAASRVKLVPPAILDAGAVSHDPRALYDALDAGAVDTLVTLDANLTYGGPAESLSKARTHIHASVLADESAPRATWFVPLAHLLESWADATAVDGTVSCVQPTVKPLYGTPSPLQLLARLAGVVADPRALVAETCRERGVDLEHALRNGVVPGGAARTGEAASALSAAALMLRARTSNTGAGTTAVPSATLELSSSPSAPEIVALELSLRADLRLRNGDVGNVGWLLELPDPLTKLTWENAALVSPRTASAHALVDGDVVELRCADGAASVTAPVIAQPGVADGVVVVHCGWGRAVEAPLQSHAGFNAWDLARFGETNVAVLVRRTGAVRELARTQLPQRVPVDAVAYVAQGAAPRARRQLPTLYAEPVRAGPQWGMTIDLDACTGCSACVVACMAENNVPIVGREQVIARREMHWLRIDRYFDGDVDEPRTISQPMMCQHCEAAPCEYVCPVNATVHSADGLNEMVYNRCVGTRFCSNNCPYKVRRFNWLDFHRDRAPVEKLVMNPDVTVRARGVMEKCTYCVQRIRGAVIKADVERRAVADGEVVPACAQTCPTDAIVFGRIDDAQSRVSALRNDRRAYAALEDEGARPRTRYLARERRGTKS